MPKKIENVKQKKGTKIIFLISAFTGNGGYFGKGYSYSEALKNWEKAASHKAKKGGVYSLTIIKGSSLDDVSTDGFFIQYTKGAEMIYSAIENV